MAVAVQEVIRGTRIDPGALVRLDYPFERYSSPTTTGNGNGHHEALEGTVPIFDASKPNDNGKSTEGDLTPLDLARYHTYIRAGDRAEREFERRFGGNGRNNGRR